MKDTLEAKLAYRENAVRGATRIELVAILFDAAIDDMRRAASAIEAGDIEQRATAIRHAMLVLQQLQGTLDFENGGQVAKRFEQFYNLIRAKLLESQLRNSPELMQQPIRFMVEVRECWMHAEKQLQPTPNPGPAAASIASARATAEDGGPKSEWNA
jgi:flagellar secretion chaperone FliS